VNPEEPTTNGGRKDAPPRGDPLYDLPLLAKADRLRYRLPLGRRLTKTEADVLRTEARALRLVANALDSRAAQLERLDRQGAAVPRLARVTVE